MKYLTAFLAEYKNAPTYGTYETRTCVVRRGETPAYVSPGLPTEPTKPIADAIPDRSVWRSVVAGWSLPKRQAWADATAALEAQGMPWNVAEWQAFQGTQCRTAAEGEKADGRLTCKIRSRTGGA